MDKVKQFIEYHIPLMDNPEKIYQLFEGLGYKTLDTTFCGKEAWGLRGKDKETIKPNLKILSNKQPIRSQKPNPLPDCKALDDIVFDILVLNQAERAEV